MSIACYRAWLQAGDGRAAGWATAALAVTGLCDGVLLAALPRLGLSFGPVDLPWLWMIFIRAGLLMGPALLWPRSASVRSAGMLVFVWALNLFILGCEVYGMYIEPFNLEVTPVRLVWPAAPADPPPFRIVHLSDFHIERTTQRERAALEAVEQLQPDLLLLTGDYLNIANLNDPQARQDARDFLHQLHVPYGVYAVSGSPPVDTPPVLDALFSDMDNITLLRDEIASLDVGGQTIYLLGVSNLELERDRASLQALMGRLPPDAFSIVMYHTPDLIETAADLGANLYLAGHTHGGQIRLPGLGALITLSEYGKRYEAGRYQVGTTQVYVSRGLGMEGMLRLPRVRFLCRPEIVVFTLASP